MKVKAIGTSGKDLSRQSLDSFHNVEEQFGLEVGGIYTVYGINIWRGIVHYLTCDELGYAYWSPAELFEIVDNRIPPDWYFKFYGYEDNDMDQVNAVWGYKELALDPKHYFELILKEGDFINIFNKKRKREIDEFHE